MVDGTNRTAAAAHRQLLLQVEPLGALLGDGRSQVQLPRLCILRHVTRVPWPRAGRLIRQAGKHGRRPCQLPARVPRHAAARAWMAWRAPRARTPRTCTSSRPCTKNFRPRKPPMVRPSSGTPARRKGCTPCRGGAMRLRRGCCAWRWGYAVEPAGGSGTSSSKQLVLQLAGAAWWPTRFVLPPPTARPAVPPGLLEPGAGGLGQCLDLCVAVSMASAMPGRAWVC